MNWGFDTYNVCVIEACHKRPGHCVGQDSHALSLDTPTFPRLRTWHNMACLLSFVLDVSRSDVAALWCPHTPTISGFAYRFPACRSFGAILDLGLGSLLVVVFRDDSLFLRKSFAGFLHIPCQGKFAKPFALKVFGNGALSLFVFVKRRISQSQWISRDSCFSLVP